jgi:phage terminase small subunit
MTLVKQHKVTEKQMALVDTLVATGCTVREAAQEAGYAEGESGRVSASKALRQPHVQQYMMERISDQLGMNATVAAAKVLKLASGAKSEYVQLEASKDILDRAGFKPIDRSQVQLAGDIKVSIDLG